MNLHLTTNAEMPGLSAICGVYFGSVAQRCRIYTQTIIHYLLFIIHLCGCAHKKAHKAAKKVQKYVCLILRARCCTATVHASSDHRRSHGSTKSTFAGKYLEGWVMKIALVRSMEIRKQIWVPPCDHFSRSFPSLKARLGGYSQA